MPKYAFITVVLITVATPALAAEYYVAQDPTTKKCKIIEQKPDGQAAVMIGTTPYATKAEAKAARKAASECVKKTKAEKEKMKEEEAN